MCWNPVHEPTTFQVYKPLSQGPGVCGLSNGVTKTASFDMI